MRMDKRTYINKGITEKMITYFDSQASDKKVERILNSVRKELTMLNA